MSTPESRYLLDVLGIQAWMAPEGVEIQAVAAFVAEAVDTKAMDLLSKMFGAIGLQGFDVLHTEADIDKFQGHFIFPFGEVPVYLSQDPRLVEGAKKLDDFFTTEDPGELKALKKSTWDNLQKLKWRLTQ